MNNGAAEVPLEIAEIFKRSEKRIQEFYENIERYPKEGKIEIDNDRYLWTRADALTSTLRSLLEEQFGKQGTDSILYNFGKAVGKSEASGFHGKFGLSDPMERLATGPIYFSYSGWAYVEILEPSRLSVDEDYLLLYRHVNSFEAENYIKENLTSDRPICHINAGYSAGWCEESFNIPLEAREVTCKAKGDEHCTFVMAHRDKLLDYLVNWRELIGGTVLD